MIEESDIPFILSVCDAYAEAVMSKSAAPLKRLGQKREEIVRVYEDFFFELQQLYVKKKLTRTQLSELYKQLGEQASKAFVEGNPKTLEKFEKQLSKTADFDLMK